ncbi:HBR061Cp [Eremothecium sinecaudum]|uniref:Structure-specific endonuclease subunit SLX4 n=1 Tax=Eremothecium sinecaudum TaxID=45286 RepID=A0A120K134_9SACH|nr:HBR061Cp [Eremothecium sinecaudum]AMD18962.1 HBR061Cp [Eremothecium sinecaudum]
MDFNKVQRNLNLLANDLSDSETLDAHELAETQTAAAFSDDEETKDRDVFLSTQVQARIDEAEESETIQKDFKKLLEDFTYERDRLEMTKTAASKKPRMANNPKVSKKANKRIRSITQHNTDKFKDQRLHGRAKHLVTMLSGKLNKVNSLMKAMQQDSVDQKYSIYDSEEWSNLVTLLRERLPKVTRSDINIVKNYVYGGELEEDPWYASQLPPNEVDIILGSGLDNVVYDNMEFISEQRNAVTLSQLLEDTSISSIPDSMDSGDRISITLSISSENEDEIIDPTKETFRVVPNITSPVKTSVGTDSPLRGLAANPNLQVPASRTTTVNELESIESLPSILESESFVVRMKLYHDQHIPDGFHTLGDEIIADSEDNEYTIAEMLPSEEEQVILSPQSSWPESVQQLRQSLKNIGIKVSRTKSQMLENYSSALENLSSQTDADRHNEIFSRLTTQLRSDPRFVSRVYCFEPFTLEELRTFFEFKDEFTKLLDDTVIREWADHNGVCIKNNVNNT